MIAWGEYSLAAFKEPRGFLKLLEWLFAICAFATVVNFSTTFGFTTDISCGNGSSTVAPLSVRKEVTYPFALDQESERIHYNVKDICPPGSTDRPFSVGFVSNVKSDSQFFVTTGVLCFLYCTVLIGIHLYADKTYMDSVNGVVIDFLITVFIALFWISGTAAWWKGVSDLKFGANPDNWEIAKLIRPSDIATKAATNTLTGSYSGLTISILLGFINFILWSTNLWFLYKETPWYESIIKRSAPTAVIAGSPSV